jgi:lysozyme family protein
MDSPAFLEALTHTVGVEGDYSDDPNDSGGKTRFGVTERLARVYGYVGPMNEMPFEFARKVYFEQFWKQLKLDEIAELSRPLANEVFDTAVNCGPAVAVKFLQRSLNVFNRLEQDYNDVEIDGLIGPMTMHALRGFFFKRGSNGVAALLKALNCLQGTYYIELVERRKKDETFVFGWLRNRVVV